MDIQQLRHFLTVIETRNIMRASIAANISQSGLSRSLSALEASVGVPLLIRKPNGVEPTDYGAKLARHAKIIIKEVKVAIDEISASKQGWLTELSIGITPSYSQHTLPDVIADLIASQPQLSVTVRTSPSTLLRDMVQDGEIDVAFGVFGALDLGPDLTMTTLSRTQPRVIARARHPLAHGEPITAQGLAQSQWALMDGRGLLSAFSTFFNNRGLNTPPQAVKTNSISVAKRIAAISDCLTIISPDLIADDITAGRLMVLDCEVPAPEARIGLIYRSAALPNRPLEAFIALMTARLSHTSSPKDELLFNQETR